jgi:phosphoinositide-3-kinase, regulatory subunit 4
VFPECFYSFLHNYVYSVNELQTPPPFASPLSTLPITTTTTASKPNQRIPATIPEGPSETLPSDSDHRMERIWADYESIVPYLELGSDDEPTMDVRVDYVSSSANTRPFQVCRRPSLFLRCCRY